MLANSKPQEPQSDPKKLRYKKAHSCANAKQTHMHCLTTNLEQCVLVELPKKKEEKKEKIYN